MNRFLEISKIIVLSVLCVRPSFAMTRAPHLPQKIDFSHSSIKCSGLFQLEIDLSNSRASASRAEDNAQAFYDIQLASFTPSPLSVLGTVDIQTKATDGFEFDTDAVSVSATVHSEQAVLSHDVDWDATLTRVISRYSADSQTEVTKLRCHIGASNKSLLFEKMIFPKHRASIPPHL